VRKLLIILGLAVVAGIFGYGLARLRFESNTKQSARTGADITWIKSEFDLSEEEFAAIRELHVAYGKVCARHCAEILEAQARIEHLRSEDAEATRIAEAAQNLTRLEAVCNEATHAHIFRVAAKMPLEKGVRFIRATDPLVTGMPHNGARGLSR